MRGQRAARASDHCQLRWRKAPCAVAMSVIAIAAALGVPTRAPAASRSTSTYSVSQIAEVSRGCSDQNAEVEQATDPSGRFVYELWMGCKGIAFARSADGGHHFGLPLNVAGSVASSWDPALAVAPNGSVYASFMIAGKGYTYPVVAASFDHGVTFSQVSSLVPPIRKNWGDRDFIAVAPNGSVYVTWDYGPSAAAVTYICNPAGSCAFATGDLNVVIQKSTDGGKTWGPIIPVSPGFPASGGDSAPLVIERDGRIDLEYQGYRITNDVTYTMTPAHSYFTSSDDGGRTWSAPVQVGPDRLTMSKAEWWIDGAIGIDAGGNLYMTWDTQHQGRDVGWLAYSTDHGRTWSPLQRVTPDNDNATHIVEVSGGAAGIAYVGWLADNSVRGYAEYLRAFSITQGWLSAPVRVSTGFGDPLVWPGDTFGISTLPPTLDAAGRRGDASLVLSWGGAIGDRAHPRSAIFAAVVSVW
jgi:BNR/Asp-box repeat